MVVWHRKCVKGGFWYLYLNARGCFSTSELYFMTYDNTSTYNLDFFGNGKQIN